MGLVDIDKFISNERLRRNFIVTYLTPIIDRYKLIRGSEGWVGTDITPDVKSSKTKAYLSGIHIGNINDLMSHMYTFESVNGHIYWAVMPYTNQSVKQIEGKLLLNGIHPLLITPYSPYADVMILFDSNDIMQAY